MFRRPHRKDVTLRPEHVSFTVDVAVELDAARKLHRRALEALDAHGRIDEDLLEQARHAAMIGRTMLSLAEGMIAELPEELQPFRALRVLVSVQCGLVALAQDPPDREGALTREELDALFDEDLDDWMRFCLGAAERADGR